MRIQQMYTTRRERTASVGRAGASVVGGRGMSGGRGSYGGVRGGVWQGGGSVAAAGWSRNCNTVRHMPKTLGSVSNMMIVAVLVLIVGLIYVSQGTQATNYDYKISAVEKEIAELQSKKEDLAVERARLTSIATAENSTVAATMEGASVAGFAHE